MRIATRIPALVLGALFAAGTLAAGDHHPQPKTRPFWGMTRGEVGWSLSETCLPYQPVRTEASAAGRLTHLGRASISLSHCANDTGGAFDGRMTLTAANGDELLATYTAQTVSVSDGLLVQQVTGTFVAGGSGRFAQAKGQFTALVYVRPGAEPPTLETVWPLDVVFAGTLGY